MSHHWPPSWIRVQVPRNHEASKTSCSQFRDISPPCFLSLPHPTFAAEYPNVATAIPLTSDPPLPIPFPPPDLPSSVDPHSEEAAALNGGIPFITRTFSHVYPTRAPSDANRMHSVLNTFFPAPVCGEEKKRDLRGRIAAERSAKRTRLHI
ncbi:hypothetical protein DFH94DRAFT_28569 [Russula ochroleuca]|uniref:Uncharacterized protein n=1 Tax=Russula ochroleuca TaxID=152965 RepID=A0A9P5MP88_9AGAM|nr:hypothetical protein DFH94DRAFT_482967 [Russula ochroleuca]KAF8487479.1 hypothetical protein DFH94DRAFT_28569 [Russula ochroleuca]